MSSVDVGKEEGKRTNERSVSRSLRLGMSPLMILQNKQVAREVIFGEGMVGEEVRLGKGMLVV